VSREHLRVVIDKKSVEAEGTVSFRLVAADGGALPRFTPGSHIDVHISGGLVRQYSLCNDPADRSHYLIGVLREPHSSGGSTTLHDHTREGDVLTIGPPRNKFHLEEHAPHSLLLAGGIGITPLLSMAHHLNRLGSEFDLHYCARSRERAAFHDLLLACGFAERVHVHFDDGPKLQQLDLVALLSSYQAQRHLYVCGPGGFMEAVISTAGRCWPSDAIHREYFVHPPKPLQDGEKSFLVKLTSTGAVLRVPSDKTIADVLIANGVGVPLSCEQGVCGTCLTKVLEGRPDHRDCFLTDAERQANNQMTLCCSRALSDVLVIDR